MKFAPLFKDTYSSNKPASLIIQMTQLSTSHLDGNFVQLKLPQRFTGKVVVLRPRFSRICNLGLQLKKLIFDKPTLTNSDDEVSSGTNFSRKNRNSRLMRKKLFVQTLSARRRNSTRWLPCINYPHSPSPLLNMHYLTGVCILDNDLRIRNFG